MGQPLEGAAGEDVPNEHLGRGRRAKKRSVLLQDFQPTSTLPFSFPRPEEVENVPPVPSEPEPEVPNDALIDPELPIQPLPTHVTLRNAFGLYKRYQTKETSPHDPDAYVSPEDLQEDPTEEFIRLLDLKVSQGCPDNKRSLFCPYPNATSYMLGDYFWSDHNEKSIKGFQRLVDIISRQEFRPEDICETDWKAIDGVLAGSEYTNKGETLPWDNHGTSWTTTTITIEVPFNRRSKRPGPVPFTIPEFHYRPLMPLIREKVQCSVNAPFFHHIPHELRWKAGDKKRDERVYSELYQSDAFLEAYQEIQV